MNIYLFNLFVSIVFILFIQLIPVYVHFKVYCHVLGAYLRYFMEVYV